MNPKKRFLSAVMILVLAISLIIPLSSAQAADGGTIKILFTHDMHCSIVPASVSKDGALTESGGFARLYTAIQQERASAPESTLLVDAGDYSNGNAVPDARNDSIA